jgi:hypothetical protein
MAGRLWLISGLALLAVACNPELGNRSGNTARADRGERPVVGVLAFAAQGCAASWNGRPVAAGALAQKSGDAMMQAIQAAGGIERLTFESLPVVQIEGMPGLDWTCAGPYVAALTDGGAPVVRLAVTGDSGGAALLGLPMPNMPPPTAAIAIDRSGYRWNGEAIDEAGLDRRLSQLGEPAESSAQAPDDVEELPPPGQIRLEPAAGATLANVLSATRTAGRHHLIPDLAARAATLPAPGEGLLPPPPILPSR